MNWHTILVFLAGVVVGVVGTVFVGLRLSGGPGDPAEGAESRRWFGHW